MLNIQSELCIDMFHLIGDGVVVVGVHIEYVCGLGEGDGIHLIGDGVFVGVLHDR